MIRWSSGGTFTSFNLRDLDSHADSLQKTVPLEATGGVVSPPACLAIVICLSLPFYTVGYFHVTLLAPYSSLLLKGGGGVLVALRSPGRLQSHKGLVFICLSLIVFAALEPELTDCPPFSVGFWHNL